MDYIKKLTLRKDTLDDAPPIAPAKKEAKLWQPRGGCRESVAGSEDRSNTEFYGMIDPHHGNQGKTYMMQRRRWRPGRSRQKEDKETTKQWDKEELWEIHESPVSTIQHTAEPTNINPVHGHISQQVEKVILDVCELSGISRGQIAAVVFGLPCESYSHADGSKYIQRETIHRDHSDPNKPPRNLESCTTKSHMGKRCGSDER